jgi:glycopeptide antibiotics resistance protein
MASAYEITALPVVIPLAVASFAVLLWRLHGRSAMTLPRILVAGIMCVYGAGVIGNTVLPVVVGAGASDLPWWYFLNLVPLVGTEPEDMLKNVAVFVPLGFLLPLISRARSLLRVTLSAFLISFAMEALQFLNAVAAGGGHIFDINDLLANTLGGPVGYGIYRLALLQPSLRRLVRAATWSAPPQVESATAR